MKKMENRMKIRKIHLQSLLQILSEIYDRGVDFVDIHGVIEDGEDTIGITFCKSYMDEEFADSFDTFGEEQLPSSIKVKLSDEDLNQLI